MKSKPSFNIKRFRDLLDCKLVGKGEIDYKKVTTSTMDDADTLIKKNCPSGSLVIAEEQTKGRGRNDRPWFSSSHDNLYFSVILRPKSIEEVVGINFAAPLAVAMSAERIGVADVQVKWPNDVWVGSRKLAGILLNTIATGCTSSEGMGLGVNLGIGINVNQEMTDVKGIESNIATSLIQENGGNLIEKEALLADICSSLEKLISLDRKELMKIYGEYDMLVGKQITVMPNKREDKSTYYNAKAIGFSPEGYLIIQRGSEKKTLSAEEVSIRPDKSK